MIYASADLIARGTQLLALPIYTSFLTVEQFGQLSLLTVSASLLAILVNLGVNNAVQRFYFESEADRKKSAITVSTGLMQLIVSGVIFSLAAILAFVAMSRAGISISGISPALYIIAFSYIIPEQITQYAQDVLRLHFRPAAT